MGLMSNQMGYGEYGEHLRFESNRLIKLIL